MDELLFGERVASKVAKVLDSGIFVVIFGVRDFGEMEDLGRVFDEVQSPSIEIRVIEIIQEFFEQLGRASHAQIIDQRSHNQNVSFFKVKTFATLPE